MTRKDAAIVARALEALALKTGASLAQDRLEALLGDLVVYRLDEVLASVNTVGRSWEVVNTFPPLACFIKAIEGTSKDADRDLSDRAAVEATKVSKAVARHSSYASVQFDDPTTAAVVADRFGGWETLCRALGTRDLPDGIYQRDFVASYCAFARQGKEHLGHLPGFYERDNAANGYDFPPPVLVGDPDRCRELAAAAVEQRRLAEAERERAIRGYLDAAKAVR